MAEQDEQPQQENEQTPENAAMNYIAKYKGYTDEQLREMLTGAQPTMANEILLILAQRENARNNEANTAREQYEGITCRQEEQPPQEEN